LWRDTTPVAGTVGFGDAAGLRAEFHPDSLLAGLTDYRLVVTPAIRDVNGGALASPVDVQFTTGAVVPAAGLVFASVSAGGQHTCGVTTGGAAYCWGDNTDGQLGNGTTASGSTPVAVAGGLTFRAVSAAASSFTCGVTTSGAAYCWGLNRDGELGLGTNTGTHTTPVAVPGGLTFVTVSTGFWHTCGVTTAGAAYCWGGDYVDGLLGDGTYAGSSGTNYRTPVPVAGGLAFAAVSAGVYHTCGVTTSGAAYCWGVHTWGRLGDGTDETGRSPLPPVAVLGGLTFAAVSAGYASTCGVTTTGSAHCWGSNGWGSLGTGTEAGPEGCPGYEIPPETYPCSRVPVAVMGGLAFGAVSVAGGACGVTALGGGYCWGANHHGQLGDGSTTNSAAPVAVAGEFTFAAISSGGGYSCGVATGGVAYCWGDNNYGQLGTGTTTGSTVPVKVAGQP
jgi:alpha-tubulin suppressor-like RCC1 family protein